MADIAEIGFKANTSELADAKAKIEGLVPAAQRAEKASDRLSKMFDRVDKAADALSAAARGLSTAADKLAAASGRAATANEKKATAVNKAASATNKATAASEAATAAANAEAAAVNKAASATDKATAARRRAQSVPSVNPTNPMNPVNDNNPVSQSAGAMKANVGNIAAQFQDIGITAAMGMNPLLIALQQGTQLSAVFAQTGGNAFRTIAGAILQVISPTALLTIGIVALVAAMVQFVNWTKLAQTVLNFMADILPEVALGVTLVGAALTIAFAPTIATTILSIASAIAVGLMGAILAIVSAIGAIPIIIGGAITAFYIFRDDMTQILGVDIVEAVKTGVNFIIGAFVAAYHDIEFLWKKFPDVIGSAAIGAANIAITAINVMIMGTIEGINLLVAQINKIGAVGEKFGIGFKIDDINSGDYKIDTIVNDAAERLKKAVGNRNKQLQEDLTKDYLGAIGGAITNAAQGAAAKMRDFSNSLDDASGGKKKSGGGGKTEGEKFEDIVKGAQRTIASLQAEKDAVGQTAEATARLKYETQLLNEAQQKNINLTPQQREQLMALAGEMANLETSTERAKKLLDFSKDTTKGFLNDFIAGLKEGKSVWESFGDAALGVLDKIGQKLVDMAIDGLFSGGSGGGLFGKLFGGLFGGGSGLSSFVGKVGLFAHGGAFGGGISDHSNSIVNRPTLFKFASGTGLMGEAGPEAILPLARGANGDLGVQLQDGGRNSGNVLNFNPVYENNYTLEGAISEAKIVSQIRAAAEDTKNTVQKEIPGWLDQYGRDGAFAS